MHLQHWKNFDDNVTVILCDNSSIFITLSLKVLVVSLLIGWRLHIVWTPFYFG